MMRPKMKLCAAAVALGVLSMGASAQEKLYVYTSMKDSITNELKKGFAKKHPEVKLDFQVAGAGKLMAKLAAERESGKILADILWTSEVPDFYQLKSRGQLLPYMPAEIKSLIQPLADYDGSFTAVRLGTLGVVYNTKKIKEAPKSWDDLKKPENAAAIVTLKLEPKQAQLTNDAARVSDALGQSSAEKGARSTYVAATKVRTEFEKAASTFLNYVEIKLLEENDPKWEALCEKIVGLNQRLEESEALRQAALKNKREEEQKKSEGQK